MTRELNSPPDERSDFSLVLGGPLFQLLRKAHLEGDHLELWYRRILVLTSVAWLPLLLLTTLGTRDGNVGRLSFFHDVELHVRFLVALPALVAAELIVHQRLSPLVGRFTQRGIVVPEEQPRFRSAIQSAMRLRNSIASEVALLLCVYGFGLWLWQGRASTAEASWYSRTGGRWALTPAGGAVPRPSEELLGAADIQSLADLGNSYG